MAYSTYQVQRFIARFRRTREASAAGSGSPPASGGFDRVLLSARAKEQAADAASSVTLPAGTPGSPVRIVDDAPLPLATRIELERRAGSFMRPPQQPSPGPAPFHRARRVRPADVMGGLDDASVLGVEMPPSVDKPLLPPDGTEDA